MQLFLTQIRTLVRGVYVVPHRWHIKDPWPNYCKWGSGFGWNCSVVIVPLCISYQRAFKILLNHLQLWNNCKQLSNHFLNVCFFWLLLGALRVRKLWMMAMNSVGKQLMNIFSTPVRITPGGELIRRSHPPKGCKSQLIYQSHTFYRHYSIFIG